MFCVHYCNISWQCANELCNSGATQIGEVQVLDATKALAVQRKWGATERDVCQLSVFEGFLVHLNLL